MSPGQRRLLLAALVTLAAATGVGWWWWRQRPLPVAVDLPLAHGAALDPTPRYTSELYLEEHPGSRIRLVNLFNTPDPASGPAGIAKLKREGVRLFISTHPSSHLVPSLGLLASGDALAINAAAASTALSGRDDGLFRVVPDVAAEQQAMARALRRLQGRRLLVLQDTANLAYTKAALHQLRAALEPAQQWQLTVHQLRVSGFDPTRDRALMQGNVDALVILAGSFQPAIGTIAQLFHQLHPEAPILLTPWARSSTIVSNTGPAASHTWLISPYPPRGRDQRIDAYLKRFEHRYGYMPNAMAIGLRQAIELLDQALSSGAQSPADVKRYLLAKREHRTSLGPIRFDATGDVQARFHVVNAAEERQR